MGDENIEKTIMWQKPIAQYSLDWEFIKEWWSISDAIRSLWPIADIYHAYDHDKKNSLMI